MIGAIRQEDHHAANEQAQSWRRDKPFHLIDPVPAGSERDCRSDRANQDTSNISDSSSGPSPLKSTLRVARIKWVSGSAAPILRVRTPFRWAMKANGSIYGRHQKTTVSIARE